MQSKQGNAWMMSKLDIMGLRGGVEVEGERSERSFSISFENLYFITHWQHIQNMKFKKQGNNLMYRSP